MQSVLIIDDEAPIRKMLEIFLKSQGFEVLEAEDGMAGVEMFEKHEPSIVLTDVRMPRMDGLELVRRIRSSDTETAVIVVTGHGGEETAIDALRAGATNYLKKPIEISELATILRRQMDIIEARRALVLQPDYLLSEERTLEMDNNTEAIPAVITHLTASAELHFSRAEVNYIKLGLDEMIRNAIEHGNFGITYEQKTQHLEEGTWDEFFTACQNDPVKSAKRVHIHSKLCPEEYRCTIEDEGNGFDWQSLPDPKEPDNLLSAHGRGILLTSFYYDRVYYNDKGNRVTIVKVVGSQSEEKPVEPPGSEGTTEALSTHDD